MVELMIPVGLWERYLIMPITDDITLIQYCSDQSETNTPSLLGYVHTLNVKLCHLQGDLHCSYYGSQMYHAPWKKDATNKSKLYIPG